MATVELTMDTFEKTIVDSGIVLVDFWAEWCGPCKQFGPTYESASNENTDVTFAKVDTEAQQQIAGAMGITSIPTIMAFKEGIGVFSQAGALPKAALDDLIGQVRGLDMDEVRESIAEQEAAAETSQAAASSDSSEGDERNEA